MNVSQHASMQDGGDRGWLPKAGGTTPSFLPRFLSRVSLLKKQIIYGEGQCGNQCREKITERRGCQCNDQPRKHGFLLAIY